MKNETYVILALIFVVFIAIFSVLNVSDVEVNYLFWKGESPLVIVILISVLLGGVLTTAFGAGKFIQITRENKYLKNKLNHLEMTIEQQSEENLIEDTSVTEELIEERKEKELE